MKFFLGMETVDTHILHACRMIEMKFEMLYIFLDNEFLLLPRRVRLSGYSFQYIETAMDHLQTSSLSDIMQLLHEE